jgi:adenylate cyclase class 2
MNMQQIEIEQKFPLYNPAFVAAQLLAKGAVLTSQNEIQDDRYFTPSHRDFMAPEIVAEWLRVRFTKNKASITYKYWHDKHCDEYESTISDPQAILAMLTALNFREIVRVNKQRSTYRDGALEIALDTVEGLGTYIEIEYKGEAESIDAAYNQISAYAQSLGADLGACDKRGYPYLLLKRER